MKVEIIIQVIWVVSMLLVGGTVGVVFSKRLNDVQAAKWCTVSAIGQLLVVIINLIRQLLLL